MLIQNLEIPTSAVTNVYEYGSYLAYILFYLDIILDFYCEHRWHQLQWKSFINKQKAFDDILCKRITNGNGDNTVVAFGDGKFSSTSRGHAPGPVKQFRRELSRHCKVVNVDEFRTSSVCSLCDGWFDKHQKFWSVRVCKSVCLTHWNRDVNAARNIRNIFLHTNTYGERPDPFIRGTYLD